jgi:hypothetical protein
MAAYLRDPKKFSKALAMVQLYCLVRSKMRGAMSFNLHPLTQEASQKRSLFPFPIVTFVGTAKRSPS